MHDNVRMKILAGFVAGFVLLAAMSVRGFPASVRDLGQPGTTIIAIQPAPGRFKSCIDKHMTPLNLLPGGSHAAAGITAHDWGPAHDSFLIVAASVQDTALWQDLANATWIAEGAREPERVIYVFTDTECTFCHALWLAMQPGLEHGNVQVRNILVAVIAPASLGRATAILTSGNPAKAWRTHERAFGHSPFKPLPSVPPRLRARITANQTLMARLGAPGTPAIIYQDRNGKIRAILGLPDKAMLREILGNGVPAVSEGMPHNPS